jgi:hypothetical protein
MKKVIENTAYWVGILTLGIVVGVGIKIVGAWVEPNQMPPGGNIAAPLNTGNIGQAKVGGLTLNVGGSTYGLIVDKGLVGIGVTAPGEKLEVNGNIKLTGDTSGNPAYKITNVIAPTGNSDVATKGYVDAAGGSGEGSNGEYTNKIPDATPPNAYSEICFKGGTTKYDNHSSSETTQGGNCVPGDPGFVIEKNTRGKANHDEARFSCVSLGMRLPEMDEFSFAMKHASEAGINATTTNSTSWNTDNFEHASNGVYMLQNGGATGSSVFIGSLFPDGSVFAGGMWDNDTPHALGGGAVYRDKVKYRCVR